MSITAPVVRTVRRICSAVLMSGSPGPAEFFHEGRQWTRHMDLFYVPRRPSQLSTAEVQELSYARATYADSVVDWDFTNGTLAGLCAKVAVAARGSSPVLLDFGCGTGNVSTVLNAGLVDVFASAVGVDACAAALKTAASQRHELELALVDPVATVLPLKDESVAGAVANFVLHLSVTDRALSELFRVLRPGSLFVANDYLAERDPSHAENTLARLRKQGFRVTTEWRQGLNGRRQLIIMAERPEAVDDTLAANSGSRLV